VGADWGEERLGKLRLGTDWADWGKQSCENWTVHSHATEVRVGESHYYLGESQTAGNRLGK
jgi:hypothetical protein